MSTHGLRLSGGSSRSPNLVPWWCLTSACAAPIVLTGAAAIAGLLSASEYNPVSDTLSSLAASGPGHWVMTAGFIVVATCTFVTAYGLQVVPKSARVALAASATCGVAIATFHNDITESVSVHIVAVVAGSALLVFWPLLVISEDRTTCRVRRVHYSIAACGVLAALSIWLLIETHGGNMVGLAERAAFVAQFSWPAVVVINARLHHAGHATGKLVIETD